MPHHWRGRGVTAPDPAPDTSLGPARRIPNPPIRCRNGLTHAQASLCPPQGVGVGAGGHARTAHDQECEEERGEVGEGQRQEVDGQARDPTGVQSQLGQSQEEERGHPGTADPDQAAELSPEGTRMASRFHTDPCVPGMAHRCRGTSLLSRGFGFPVLYILIRCIFANDLHDAPHHHHHTCTCRRRSRRHHRVVGCQGGNETPEFASMDLPGSQDDDDDDEVPDSPEPEDEPADKSPELETARASARRPAKPSTAKKGKKTPKSAKSVKKTAQKAPVEEEEELPEPSPPPKKGGKKKVTKPKYKAETKAQPKKKTKSAPEEPATPKEEFVPLDESMVEMPSDMAASRRSSRNRVTPCAFWKNERVVYEEGAYCVLRPRALKLFTEAVFFSWPLHHRSPRDGHPVALRCSSYNPRSVVRSGHAGSSGTAQPHICCQGENQAEDPGPTRKSQASEDQQGETPGQEEEEASPGKSMAPTSKRGRGKGIYMGLSRLRGHHP